MNDATMNTNYAAVLADLERKRAELDSAIAAIRAVIGAGGGAPASGEGEQPKNTMSMPPSTPGQIRSDAFIGMSIAEASKKYLGMCVAPQSTATIVAALTMGGIPQPAYNTVYAVLSRQERQSGDIFKLLHTKEWALPEWYGGKIPKQRKASGANEEASESSE